MKQVHLTTFFMAIAWIACIVVSDSHAVAQAGRSGLMIPNGFYYPPEHIYDMQQHKDDALVNLRVESNRWPDCYTFESAVQSIFRIEGVSAGSDEEKAMALWKWSRILLSATGSGYAYEGEEPGKEKIVFDGHKILTVYGHHQCDGLSWAIVPFWRAAGYMAFDEASHGHTTVSLRYQDHDGKQRFHSFDPQGRFIWWNSQFNIVGNRTLPLMQGSVHRHLTLPQNVHHLGTSLHQNETLERRWENVGHVIPYGKHPLKIAFNSYYRHRIGRKDGVYATAGMEIQHFTPVLSPQGYQKDLDSLSENIQALSRLEKKGFSLHPAQISRTGKAVYRIHSPYAAVNAAVELTYRLTGRHDRLQVYLSRNANDWKPVFKAEKKGEHHVRIDLGRKKRELGRPGIYTAYTFFLKVEMAASDNVRDVGFTDFDITVYRTLNKRTLPNLMPGDNIFRVRADEILPGRALELVIKYDVKKQALTERHVIESFPYYFNVRIKNAAHEIRSNYDKVFGRGDVQMKSMSMRMVDAPAQSQISGSALNRALGQQLFEKSHPHPAGSLLIRKKAMNSPAAGTARADGFFPQKGGPSYSGNDRKKYVSGLIKTLRESKDSSPVTWKAAEALGEFPEAVDALLEELHGANIDLTVFICKALSCIQSSRAIDPLLEKWEQAPSGAPGTRYIPDVLAAIGERRVVPHLIKKLKHVRFDFRFHIARALGILGGNEARQALEDLSVNDPFPAVRKMAGTALSELNNR